LAEKTWMPGEIRESTRRCRISGPQARGPGGEVRFPPPEPHLEIPGASVRKSHASEAEQRRVLHAIRQAMLRLEVRMEGPTLAVRDLLELRVGNLLTFDYPVVRPIELTVNGVRKFAGQVVSTGKKRAFLVELVRPTPSQRRITEEGEDPDGSGAGG
jgi:flagellar motor switch/type III secretory pathway protein FliN